MNDQLAILYVEDDPRSRKVMKLLLQNSMGLTNVTILEDSTDFIERVKVIDPKPDVIFLDIHVTPYNGFQMLSMLQEQAEFRETPIVALTASVMNEEIQQLRTAGFQGCLAKPIDADTFPDMIARIVEGESIWRVMS